MPKFGEEHLAKTYAYIIAHAVDTAETVQHLQEVHSISGEEIRRGLDAQIAEHKCDRQFLVRGLDPVIAAVRNEIALCSDCDGPAHEGACEDQQGEPGHVKPSGHMKRSDPPALDSIIDSLMVAADTVRRLRDGAKSPINATTAVDARIRDLLNERINARDDIDREFVLDNLRPALMTFSAGIDDICPYCIARDDEYVSPTETAIRRALAASTSPIPDQAPAIECAVVLRGMSSTIVGALSETPEGGLRLLSPIVDDGSYPRRGEIPMVEQFFDYGDVLVFAVRRSVKIDASQSPILRPHIHD